MTDIGSALGTIGTDLGIRADGSHLEHAAELEELGFGALWIAGGQIDGLERIADVVRATRRIPVVPSIIPTGVYGADDVAALYRELETEHPGRFVAGLGAPQQPRAMAALGTYLDRLDSPAAAVPSARRLLAALGPRKLELARDRFAGAVPLLVTPEYTAWAREVLGPDRLLAVQQLAVLDDDPDRARDAARGVLGFPRACVATGRTCCAWGSPRTTSRRPPIGWWTPSSCTAGRRTSPGGSTRTAGRAPTTCRSAGSARTAASRRPGHWPGPCSAGDPACDPRRSSPATARSCAERSVRNERRR